MKSIAILALAITLTGAAHAQEAPACTPVEQTLAVIEANKLEHVVLRGEATAKFIEIRVASGAEKADFDFVMVVFVPDKGAAFVAYGRGTDICDAVVIPLAMAKSLLRSA